MRGGLEGKDKPTSQSPSAKSLRTFRCVVEAGRCGKVVCCRTASAVQDPRINLREIVMRCEVICRYAGRVDSSDGPGAGGI
jgi:hypothetical protein